MKISIRSRTLVIMKLYPSGYDAVWYEPVWLRNVQKLRNLNLPRKDMVFVGEMNLEKPKYRVNGSLLSSKQGQNVCVLGTAHSQSPDGNSFRLTTSDGKTVTVQVSHPIQEYVDGLVEVQGQVDNQNNIICHQYVKFEPDSAQNFDMDNYNKAVELMNQYPEHYIQGVRTS